MRKLALLGLFGLATPALAADIDEQLGSVESVAFSAGTVEVPLYASPAGDGTPCIKALIGGKEYILELMPGSTGLWLSEGVAADLEVEPRTKVNKGAGEISSFALDSIQISGLTLTDVVARTSVATAGDIYDRLGGDSPAKVGPDGGIGLAGLGIAWAIVPSQGAVRFAPADQGAALGAGVGAASLKWHLGESGPFKFGKIKGYHKASGIVDDLLVGGQLYAGTLAPGRETSVISAEAPLPEGAPASSIGDLDYAWVELGIGSVKATTWAERATDFGLYAQTGQTADWTVVVGGSVLSGLDYGVDPSGGSFHFAPAATRTELDPGPVLLARAMLALEESDEDEDAKKEPAPADETPKPAGTAPAWTRIGLIKAQTGDKQGAVEAYANAVAFDDTACAPWIDLGKAQRAAGKLDEAATSLEKASTLYHLWWDLPLKERGPLEDDLAWAKEHKETVEGVAEGTSVQPGACHVADSALASVYLVQGETEKVEALYRAHLDLDPGLAAVLGNAFLLAGEPARAQEPYRQAVHLRGFPNEADRLGLALTYAGIGDWEQAASLATATFALGTHTEPVAIFAWLDALEGKQGAAAALESAKAIASADPGSATAALGWLRSAAHASADTAAPKAAAERLVAMNGGLDRYAFESILFSLTGNASEALAKAELATTSAPADPLSWYALSLAKDAAGDAAGAAAARKDAAAAGALNPAYALLLAKT